MHSDCLLNQDFSSQKNGVPTSHKVFSGRVSEPECWYDVKILEIHAAAHAAVCAIVSRVGNDFALRLVPGRDCAYCCFPTLAQWSHSNGHCLSLRVFEKGFCWFAFSSFGVSTDYEKRKIDLYQESLQAKGGSFQKKKAAIGNHASFCEQPPHLSRNLYFLIGFVLKSLYSLYSLSPLSLSLALSVFLSLSLSESLSLSLSLSLSYKMASHSDALMLCALFLCTVGLAQGPCQKGSFTPSLNLLQDCNMLSQCYLYTACTAMGVKHLALIADVGSLPSHKRSFRKICCFRSSSASCSRGTPCHCQSWTLLLPSLQPSVARSKQRSCARSFWLGILPSLGCNLL